MGPVHAGLQVLLRQTPQLMIELLIHAGVLPKDTATWRARLRPTEAIIIRPDQQRREVRADVVLIAAPKDLDVDDRRARKRALKQAQAYSVVFEFQRVQDPSRPDIWADYWSAYRLELGQKIHLVILTFDPRVAEWAALETKRIDRLLHVFVLTPADCPRWSNVDAERDPERAVLNAVLHARDEAQLDLVHGALAAIEALDEGVDPSLDTSLAIHYEEMLVAQLGKPLIRQAIVIHIRDLSAMQASKTAIDYLNSPRPIVRIAAEYGVEEGRQEGLQEGRQEGELAARAKVVVELLDHRGVALDPESRARILACREPKTLARWLFDAFGVSSSEELLE